MIGNQLLGLASVTKNITPSYIKISQHHQIIKHLLKHYQQYQMSRKCILTSNNY